MQSFQRPISIILGGGAGTRLFPLTQDRSKPAVPIGGKFRLIDIPISNCLNSEIYHTFILTQFNSGSLNQHVSRSFPMPNFLNGFVEVLAATVTDENDEWYQGTADAVRQNLWYILRVARRRGFKQALILSGDHLYRMDYRKLLRFHEERQADISVAVLLVPPEDATGFGILQVDRDLEIVRFVEKPKDPEVLQSLRVEGEFAGIQIPPERPYLASMGIYVFDLDVLEELLEGSSANDFGKEILPNALGNKRMYAYPFDGYWRDIGTIRSYYQANLEMCAPIPEFDFFPDHSPFYTRVRSLPPAKIRKGKLDRTLIAEGVDIGENCHLKHSVIGLRAVIQKNVELEDVVLFGNTRFVNDEAPSDQPAMGIGEGSILKRCIVDKDVRIGKNVIIEGSHDLEDGDHGLFFVHDGLVIIPRKTVLPDGFRIGS